MEHLFTANIKDVLARFFGKDAGDIFEKSQLIQYINEKTRSAGRGSKARSSFGSLYALYSIIEDYIQNGFHKKEGYSDYEGAIVKKYMACIEEIINIPMLNLRLNEAIKQGYLSNILDEIVLQSKVEFNYPDEEDEA